MKKWRRLLHQYDALQFDADGKPIFPPTPLDTQQHKDDEDEEQETHSHESASDGDDKENKKHKFVKKEEERGTQEGKETKKQQTVEVKKKEEKEKVTSQKSSNSSSSTTTTTSTPFSVSSISPSSSVGKKRQWADYSDDEEEGDNFWSSLSRSEEFKVTTSTASL